jgi:hypothetical protein
MRADLTRRTTGLSEVHRQMIRLLAEIAVTDYLREIEAPSPGSPPGESSRYGEARESVVVRQAARRDT